MASFPSPPLTFDSIWQSFYRNSFFIEPGLINGFKWVRVKSLDLWSKNVLIHLSGFHKLTPIRALWLRGYLKKSKELLGNKLSGKNLHNNPPMYGITDYFVCRVYQILRRWVYFTGLSLKFFPSNNFTSKTTFLSVSTGQIFFPPAGETSRNMWRNRSITKLN